MSLFLLSLSLWLCQAAATIPTGKDSCGDPLMVSDLNTLCTGTVLQVHDGRTATVELDRECLFSEGNRYRTRTGRVRVRLVQLEVPFNRSPLGQASRKALSSRILGKQIDVLPSHFQRGRDLIAMVHWPANDKNEGWAAYDQSIAQLEAGLASYKNYGPYALDWYMECKYEQAEDRARRAGIGIWAKNDHPRR